MDYRPLGRTGLAVSPISFGAFKIGRNEGVKYPTAYDLPSDEDAANLLHAVLDMGINLIDTAPAYGCSEERIGRFLASRRKDFILSTKVGETFEHGRSTYDFTAAAVRRSLEHSLRRLRTETIDILLVHSDGNDVSVLQDTSVVDTLHAVRDEGLARFIGFSGKCVAGAIMALDWADVLMVEYSAMRTDHSDVIEQAAARGVGILVKKGLASGQLPPQEAIPFVLANQGVSSLVIGGSNLQHLRDNVLLAPSTPSNA